MLKEDVSNWVKYLDYLLKEKKFEEVVDCPDLLETVKNELKSDKVKTQKKILKIIPKIELFIDDLIKSTSSRENNKPLSEYVICFNEYNRNIDRFIENCCEGRRLIFDIAWNIAILKADDERKNNLLTFYINNFGLDDKNINNSNIIIEKKMLFGNDTDLLDKFIVEIDDDKILLLPKGVNFKLFFRHGESIHNSSEKKVGALCKNYLTKNGRNTAKKLVNKTVATLGLLENIAKSDRLKLDFRLSRITVSNSPNTKEVANILVNTISKIFKIPKSDIKDPKEDKGNYSQSFGLETNLEKKIESKKLKTVTKLSDEELKAFIKSPFRIFLGGQSKINYFIEDILTFRQEMEDSKDKMSLDISCTHSSRLNNILIFLSPEPFYEAYIKYNAIRENTETPVLTGFDQNMKCYLRYDALVGETTIRKEQKINYTSKIKSKDIKKIGILFSGGISPGMNNILKGAIIASYRNKKELIHFRNGFRGLTLDFPLYGECKGENFLHLLGTPGARTGAGRFMEFSKPGVVDLAVEKIKKAHIDFLICVGGNGTMQGANALAQKEVPTIAIQASIDGDGYGYTVGFDSAVTHNAEKINKFYKPDSGSMRDYVYDVVTMGRNSGHLALDTALLTGPSGLFVPEITVTPKDINRTAKKIISSLDKGNSHVIVRSEHPSLKNVPKQVGERINELLGYPVKIVTEVIGREQRAATIVPTDGLIAQKMGMNAIEFILNDPMAARGKTMVSLDRKNVQYEDIPYAINHQNIFNVKGYYEWLKYYGSLNQ